MSTDRVTRPPLNIYCDESTHIEGDGQPFLVLGAVKCLKQMARATSDEIRAIKDAHGLKPYIEAKWTNVAPSNVHFYLNLIDYFFNNDLLNARVVVAPKQGLDHRRFNQTYDEWYFKMYYQLLQRAINSRSENFVYIDIKDTRSAGKVAILHEYLANTFHDFDAQIIRTVQVIRSNESELMQLADIIVGAVNYANKRMGTSEAKWSVVERIRDRSGLTLVSSTAPSAQKLNLFHWRQQRSM